MRFVTRSKIIGTGMTKLFNKSGFTATELMQQALELALVDAGVRLRQLDGLIAVPALSEPRFMEAHYLGTRMGLLPRFNAIIVLSEVQLIFSKGVVVKTIDTGFAYHQLNDDND